MSVEIKHAEFCVLGCFFPGNPNPVMQGSNRGETFKGFCRSSEPKQWRRKTTETLYISIYLIATVITMSFWTNLGYCNFILFIWKLLQSLVLHSYNIRTAVKSSAVMRSGVQGQPLLHIEGICKCNFLLCKKVSSIQLQNPQTHFNLCSVIQI